MTHVTKEFYWVHLKQFSKLAVRLAQIVHLSCIGTNTVSKQTETGFHKTHIT
jgi:hypothetical protein